ncbi:MAG: lipid-A-disaccharide synthase, partial [Bacteroidota bacterium]
MPKKLYILAGESSGDLHASNLLKALKTHLPDVQTRGMGGDRLKAEGMELIRHTDTTSFMGFLEVAMHLRTIRRMFGEVKRDIEDWQPDAVLFVDYPGFNLRMANWVHTRGIKTIWYISPQVWAWGQDRLPKMKARIDHMMCILPFEQAFFRAHGIEVAYVGHPLLDAIKARDESGKALFQELELDPAKPVVALLPGSRSKEIARLLPMMLRLAKHYPQHQFVVAGTPGKTADFYSPYLERNLPNLRLAMNRLPDLLQIATRAIVCSGTATLETALYGVPQIVVYRA